MGIPSVPGLAKFRRHGSVVMGRVVPTGRIAVKDPRRTGAGFVSQTQAAMADRLRSVVDSGFVPQNQTADASVSAVRDAMA